VQAAGSEDERTIAHLGHGGAVSCDYEDGGVVVSVIHEGLRDIFADGCVEISRGLVG
jgi:hypothetical protein